jgi:hypothetical protein
MSRATPTSGNNLSTHVLRHGQFHLLCFLRFKPLRALPPDLMEKREQQKQAQMTIDPMQAASWWWQKRIRAAAVSSRKRA